MNFFALWILEAFLAGLPVIVLRPGVPRESNDLFLFCFLLSVGTLTFIVNEAKHVDKYGLEAPVVSLLFAFTLISTIMFILGYVGQPTDFNSSVLVAVIVFILCTAIRSGFMYQKYRLNPTKISSNIPEHPSQSGVSQTAIIIDKNSASLTQAAIGEQGLAGQNPITSNDSTSETTTK